MPTVILSSRDLLVCMLIRPWFTMCQVLFYRSYRSSSRFDCWKYRISSHWSRLSSQCGDEMPRNLLKDCTRLVTALVRIFILCCSLINFVIHAPAISLNKLSVCSVSHGRRFVKLSSEQTMIDGKAHNLDRRWYLISSIVQTDRSIEMKCRQLFPLLNRSKVFAWSISVR